jgi:hypothetical protein
MKKENRFYNWIKENTKNIYLIKIEHSLTVGIPDLMTILNGVINLIELKQINSNTLENWGLNKFQRAFHIKHNQAGGRCFILVNRDKQSDLKLLRLGAGGYSHILTQPKTRDGLQKILTAIKTYKN